MDPQGTVEWVKSAIVPLKTVFNMIFDDDASPKFTPGGPRAACLKPLILGVHGGQTSEKLLFKVLRVHKKWSFGMV